MTLTARTIHLNGEHSDARRVFDQAGGSIGRGAECDLVLPDPDRRVSRLQARISFSGGQYLVVNASTSNPMYVNGVELVPGSTRVIVDGDELRAGSYVLAVARDTQRPAPTAELQLGPSRVPAGAAEAGVNDPLLALAQEVSGATAGLRENPFADLLNSAAPFQQGEDLVEGELRAVDLSVNVPPFERDSVDLLGTRNPVNERVPATAQAVELTPLGTNPTDPFESLLSQARPIGLAGEPLCGDEPQMPRSDLDTDGQLPIHCDAPYEPSERAPSLNPLALPPLEPGQSASAAVDLPYQSPLTALTGDPFADLMGHSVDRHLANAKALGRAESQSASFIPDDFNPLATGGVAHRNTEDPLTELGIGARGLDEVLPESTIDTIYNPSVESPTSLAIDPLDEARERSIRMDDSLDPLKLFASDQEDLIRGEFAASAQRSIHNHASELAAFFKAPVPRLVTPDSKGDRTDEMLAVDLSATETDYSEDRVLPAQGAGLSAAPPGVQESAIESAALNMARAESDSTGAFAEVDDADLPPTELVSENIQSTPSASWREAGNDDLVLAFRRGAGLDNLSSEAVTPQMMETVGRLLNIAAQGAVDLLAARAAVKQGVHLSVTLINPKSNNPLKFLPDGQTALLQMLGPRMPGFMEAGHAMKEAFDDLVAHQTAIAAGTQATIDALFRRFSPEVIESRYPQSGVGERMSKTLHHARLWNIYTAQYQQIQEEIKDGFFKRLGAEFQDAYNREHERDASD